MEAVPDKGAQSEALSADRPTTATISREIVQTLKQDSGRGPVKARTYIHDDCVLVLLREGHTPSEHTMAEGGLQRAVAQGRVDLSEAISAKLVAIVERTLGRKVLGFMSSSQQDPDLLSYVFVCETFPLLARPDGDDAA